MATLFISDLHLSEKTPLLTAHFLQFLEQDASKAEQLYILGDLFEAWVGDDTDEPFVQEIIKALAKISLATAIFIMPGNRDFLIGGEFATKCGARLLSDPSVIDLYGTPTLLTHGDLLCTDDTAYQRFRKVTHCRWLQRLTLWLPLSLRRKIAEVLRKRSHQHTQSLSTIRMDVTRKGILQMLKNYKVSWLIHGHTHRPAIHYFFNNDQPVWHFVLSDWHDSGNALICEKGRSPRLISLG